MKFNVPKSPKRDVLIIDEFLGVDFTNSPANIDDNKSPNAVNMIRDVPGKVRKRQGYELYKTFTSGTGPEEKTASGSNIIIEDSMDEKVVDISIDGKTDNFVGVGTSGTAVINVKDSEDNIKSVATITLSGPLQSIDVLGTVTEVSGTSIHITDSLDAPFNNLELSGATSGTSVKITNCKKNFLKNTATSQTINGVTFTVNSDKSVTVNGTASANISFQLATGESVPKGTYIVSDNISDGTINTYYMTLKTLKGMNDSVPVYTSPATFTITENTNWNWVAIVVKAGTTVPNLTFYPMIRLASNTDATYEPYTEQTATLTLPSTIGASDKALVKRGGVYGRLISGTFTAYSSAIQLEICKLRSYSGINNISTNESVTITTKYYKQSEDVETIKDTMKKNIGSYGIEKKITYLSSYNNEIINTYYVSSTGALTVGAKVLYAKSTSTFTNLDATSDTALDNLKTLLNYSKITTTDALLPTLTITYKTNCGDRAINGYHYRRGDTTPLIHVGTRIYKGNTRLYSDANDAISHSWQFNDNLYIIDGLKMLVYNGTTVVPVSSVAYTPTLTIAKAPNGGGTQYEDFNLLQPGFTELFAGTAGATQYYMTFGDLDATTVTASILNANGDWVAKTEGTDFTVNRTTGVITFTTAPGESVITGEDNVKITAYRTVEGYADRVNKCKFGTRFGVNGAFDRLFISGNPDFINFDWYSQQWDATYFSDTSYSTLGSSASAVVGYSIISNYLAAHKDEMEQDLSIILRQGDLVESKPSFKIVNTLQGAGAISTNSFNYLCTEPVFLTRSGIYAVTAQDITGEKYAQNRSFYINGKMLKEDFDKLKNSFSIIYNDMYILAVNNHLYILDGLQPIKTDKSMPYATRQYVGFYCENVPARCMWEYENRLYFGTADGYIYRFYNDKDSLTSYSDNGTAISAKWETADLDGKLFYKNKTFRFLSVKLGSAISTSLEIYAQKQGVWGFIKQDNTTGRYFSFQHMTFSKLSFSCNTTQRVSSTKLSVKKVDKARFRFENKELNEPFGLFSIALEYQESGNAKG